MNDRQLYLTLFLRFGRILTEQEVELVVQEQDVSELIKESKPTLSDFKREIDYFMDLYKKCEEEIDNEKILCRWFRIDLTPYKQVLLNTICKWANLWKQYLVDRINTQ